MARLWRVRDSRRRGPGGRGLRSGAAGNFHRARGTDHRSAGRRSQGSRGVSTGDSPDRWIRGACAGPESTGQDWPERLGIVVSELKPATGKAVLNPKPGDLWFFSNSSTTWGAANTKNAVWVIDAKTKQTVAEAAPFDGEGNSSTASLFQVTADSCTCRCSAKTIASTSWTGGASKWSRQLPRSDGRTTTSCGTT